MIILGIDPGTARMGYGVIEFSKNKKVKLISTDVIETSKDLEQHKRLKFLYKSLNEITKQYKPDVMVIEKLFFNINVKTAMNVGQARGVALLAAAAKNMDYFEYTAIEAKFVVGGHGRCDKKQMQEAVKNYFGLDTIIKSDDANDAVAMALCFVQKEILPKVKAGFKI
jgi:crossover junction endodeoxyribonuclease RuvC